MNSGFASAEIKELYSRLSGKVGLVSSGEPMSEHTTFRCGGRAALYARPASSEELVFCIRTIAELKAPAVFLGNGSNTLFTDAGYKGCVVQIAEGLSQVRFEGEEVFAEPGLLLSALSRMAAERSLAGLEFASGIPGSVGGAVFMNAGAYGGQMSDVVVSVTSVTGDGKVVERGADELKLSYRHSVYTDNGEIITGVKLRLTKGDREEIDAKIADFTARRKSKQPLAYPSAGSFFKRPEGYFAGKLIEDAGLKGLKVGGAAVSSLHAGFIINEGGATAGDVIDLMKIVQETVLCKFGVMLEPEVRIIGDQA